MNFETVRLQNLLTKTMNYLGQFLDVKFFILKSLKPPNLFAKVTA